jgi:hypothetical protein
MSVLAEHRENGSVHSLGEDKAALLSQQDQAFLQVSYGTYNFICDCHTPSISMHIKHRAAEGKALYWLADNPKSPGHDPLCQFFTSKAHSESAEGDKWALKENIKVANARADKQTALGTANSPSKSTSRHRLLKRILYRGLTESLALYNFGQKHELNYVFFKFRESPFARKHKLEGTPLSKLIFAGKKGLVYMRKSFSDSGAKAGILLLDCNTVKCTDKWLTVDQEHYPCFPSALDTFKSGTGPYLLAMLWVNDGAPKVAQAIALPIVHNQLCLPLHPNGPSRASVYQAVKQVKQERTGENKMYLRVNMLAQAGAFETRISTLTLNGRTTVEVE